MTSGVGSDIDNRLLPQKLSYVKPSAQRRESNMATKPARRKKRIKLMDHNECEKLKRESWKTLHQDYEFEAAQLDEKKFREHLQIMKAWWHRYMRHNEVIDLFSYVDWLIANPGRSY